MNAIAAEPGEATVVGVGAATRRDRPAGLGDREVLGMARGGGLNVASAIVSQAALLAITFLMVRTLGKRDVGLYAVSFAFLALLSLFALSGLRAGLTRFVAVHLADRDQPAVHGTVRLGVGLSTAGAVLLGLLLFITTPALVAAAFHDQQLVTPLRFVAIALPASTFTDAALAASQGYRTMKPYAFIGLIYEPVTRFLLTLLFIRAGMGLTGAMMAVVVSNYTAATLAFFALRRLLGPAPSRFRYAARQLFSFSTVSWFASLATTGLVWADTLLLGHFLPSEETGTYSVATRLVVLATFVAGPISASFAPRIAHLYHLGELVPLARAYTAATSWVLRLSLPAFVVLLIFAADLLGLFGSEYRVGALVAVVLAIGKVIDASTGPCGTMLNQSGCAGLAMIDNVGALILNIGLNLWLIPKHGILGSALAWALSLAVVNVVRLLQVRVVLGMLPFDNSLLKGFTAAAAAFAAGAGCRAIYPAPWQLPIGAIAVVAVYATVLVALGVSKEDRVLLDSLRSAVLQRRSRQRPSRDPARAARAAKSRIDAIAAEYLGGLGWWR